MVAGTHRRGLPYPTSSRPSQQPDQPPEPGTATRLAPSPVEAFQATLSPTGAESERQLWTTTPATVAAADQLAAALFARGYRAERSGDESDPGELPHDRQAAGTLLVNLWTTQRRGRGRPRRRPAAPRQAVVLPIKLPLKP